jgi:hypothetical protein
MRRLHRRCVNPHVLTTGETLTPSDADATPSSSTRYQTMSDKGRAVQHVRAATLVLE